MLLKPYKFDAQVLGEVANEGDDDAGSDTDSMGSDGSDEGGGGGGQHRSKVPFVEVDHSNMRPFMDSVQPIVAGDVVGACIVGDQARENLP